MKAKNDMENTRHYQIEAETKWQLFSRRYFQKKMFEFWLKFTEVCSQESN